MKQEFLRETLEKQGLTIFTSQELRRAAQLTPASAKFLLNRGLKRGVFLKLKENRGLYGFKSRPPHKWLVANRLVRPSYISLESAMAHYGAIPEAVYGVTSVTPLTTRSFKALETLFTYQKIKQPAFTGYAPLSIDGNALLVAEPEKALADYLYFAHLGRKPLNDRIRWALFNRRKILSYLTLFKRKNLIDWADHVIRKND